MLAKEQIAINFDFIDAPSAFDERGFNIKGFFDHHRQTGSSWAVISLHAKFNADLHDLLLKCGYTQL
jgi:hypothetical protein